jgi:ribonuclease R
MKRSKGKQRRDEPSDKPAEANGDWRSSDPDAGAEAARYAQPLPSRQLIQRTITDRMADGPDGEAPTLDDLIGVFGLDKLSEQEGLSKRLVAMVRDGQLTQDRRAGFRVEAEAGPRKPDPRVVEGRVIAHKDGFGFLQVGNGEAIARASVSPPRTSAVVVKVC